VPEPVATRFGIPVYLKKLEDQGHFPAVLFEQATNSAGQPYPFKVLSNLFASRSRLALAIDSTPDRLAENLVKRVQPLSPQVVGKNEAPVKEVVLIGDQADINLLPIVTHHTGDAGAYITAASLWCRDIDTGEYNCAIIRIWAREKSRLGIHLNPSGHSYFHYLRWAKQNKPMPVAICIGHHPAFYLGCLAKVTGNEIEYIGGVLGEPLAVTASEMLGDDFLVPANAEIVLEGEIPPNILEPEGPFGDFTGYTDPVKPHNVLELSGMSLRRDAIYLDVFSGRRDHFLMDAPMLENTLLQQLRQVVPTVLKVFLPSSACCRFHAYIQMAKTNDSQPRTVIARALTADFRLKHVVVVDEDIDVENEAAVWWAVSTRSQWDRDLVILNNVNGSVLDPSGENGMTAKGGIDATVPLNRKFPSRNMLPEDI
jgi:2,5-furandicarboxylate decarboxylase 1